MTLHTSREELVPLALAALEGAYAVGSADEVEQRLPLVIERITG